LEQVFRNLTSEGLGAAESEVESPEAPEPHEATIPAEEGVAGKEVAE
jgi:hypothetical protein